MSVHSQLREIEKEKKKLAAKQKRLEAKASMDDTIKTKFEGFAKENGYRNGKALAKSLTDIYGVGGGGSGGARRSRTKVTAELRDAVKAEVAGGKSKNSVSKARSISYIVVDKMIKGGYDHL